MKAKFDVVGVLIRKATLFGKKSTACVIPPLVEKFADIKVRGVCLLCENTVFYILSAFSGEGKRCRDADGSCRENDSQLRQYAGQFSPSP